MDHNMLIYIESNQLVMGDHMTLKATKFDAKVHRPGILVKPMIALHPLLIIRRSVIGSQGYA